MSVRFKHLIVSGILWQIRVLRRLLLSLIWIARLLLTPLVVVVKWLLRPVVFLFYGWYLKLMVRLKRSAFMQNKVLFIFGNRYFIHVIALMITVFVASTNLLQAKEVNQNEIYAQNSPLYTIVNPDGGIADEITETGFINKESTAASYIATDGAVVATIPNLDPTAEPPRTIGDQLALVENTSAFVGSSSIETTAGIRNGITEYKVKEGDSIGSIAERFGVTVNTILWANKLTASSYIRPGDTIKIAPASGVLHTVVDGDTLEKIIAKYNGDLDKTVQINDINTNHYITVGTEILVVNGAPPPPPPVQRYYSDYSGSSGNVFRNENYSPVVTGQQLNWPVGCRSTPTTYWGHGLARDIACPMGTPVYAAESGTVYIRNSAGYGGGYGLYLDIAHPNGMTTRYAHLSAFNVSNGAYVSRGQVVAFVGSTGRSTGPHLHFEVTVNGIKQEPLYFIQ